MNSSAEDVEKPRLTKAEVVIEDSEPEPAPQGLYFIDWEAHDLEDSMNWAPRKKWKTVSIVSCMAAITSLGSSIMAPATPQIMREFESTNYELAVFVISIGVLGYGIGPLVLSPLSEIYGRAPIYHITNVLFVIFAVACTVAPSLSSLIGFRFLVGLAASVPASVGGGTIADLFVPNERGKATSIYGFGVLLGPCIGPLVGGPLAQHKGWRWVFWLLAILGAAMTLVTLVFYRETYRPILLKQKLARVLKERRDDSLKMRQDPRSPLVILKHGLIRPLKLLLLSPTVTLACISNALIFSYFYLLIATFPRVFQEQYGFTPTGVGLSYLGLGIGNIFGLVFFAASSDRYIKRIESRRQLIPEDRLAPIYIGSPFITGGLLWYGWSAERQLHWIMPIIGSGIFGFGSVVFTFPIVVYLIDSWKLYAASAVAANVFLRSLMGAVLPLATQKLYERLGLGWGNSVLALIALVTAPLPWFYYRHGKYLRERFPVKL